MPMPMREDLGNERLVWMYTQMARIREFEEHVKRTFLEHPGAMRFGGSMHLADPANHFPGTSAIVGQSIAHAAGAALTAQVKKTGQVVYCFFGDGAAKQGAFFETLNLAAVWKLPVVFILENNEYQAYTHISLEDANCIAGDPLSKKAAAFSIPGVTVDGTDPLKVYDEVGKAADRARVGEGPSLIESKFYRFSAHGNAITVPPAPTQFPEHEAVGVYGNKDEYMAARERDPNTLFRARLLREGVLRDADAKKIEDFARAEMDDAVAFALASPLPSPEEATNYVFA